MNAFFVTGTDTEIGKTTITAGLTYLAAQCGLLSVAVKPLASGQELVNGQWLNDDVQRLRAATNVALTDAQVGPLQLRTPCAPHIAAKLEGVRIDRHALQCAVRETLAKGEIGFVEGVGGFQVPLTEDWNTADLAVDLNLPVVLVVGLRLGCINHALLTAESIRSRGLHLAGWVANTVDPEMSYVDENIVALTTGLQVPSLGLVPRLENPGHAAVAAHLRLNALLQTIEKR